MAKPIVTDLSVLRTPSRPTTLKRGRFAQKVVTTRRFTDVELQKLSPNHDAVKNPLLTFSRSEVKVVDCPALSRLINMVDFIFADSPPISGESKVVEDNTQSVFGEYNCFSHHVN